MPIDPEFSLSVSGANSWGGGGGESLSDLANDPRRSYHRQLLI